MDDSVHQHFLTQCEVLDPSVFRVSVVGDVDKLEAPKGVLARTFADIKVTPYHTSRADHVDRLTTSSVDGSGDPLLARLGAVQQGKP